MSQKNIKTLKEIDKVFKETLAKLNALHVEKMALIQHYLDLENKNKIEEIRKNIKKS